MTMTARKFARSTEPAPATLTAALMPLFSAAISWSWSDGTVVIDADWSSVNLASVQAVIDACVARTSHTDAREFIDGMPEPLKAAFLVILDEINVIRTKTGTLPIGGARTEAQFFNAIKAKADTL